MHPCTWCDVKSKCLAKSGNLRTLGSIKSSLESFQQSGRVVANAKLFGNVIRKPIISGPDNVLISEIIPPMELHFLLGVVNHLFKTLKTAWIEAVMWPAALHIQHIMGASSTEMNAGNLLKMWMCCSNLLIQIWFPTSFTQLKHSKVSIKLGRLALDSSYNQTSLKELNISIDVT